jgi:hypothetical protein
LLSDHLVAFAQTQLGSVWALKLMLTLMQTPERAWSVQELVQELRASFRLVDDLLLPRFEKVGLIVKESDKTWIWRPATPELDELAKGIAEAYAVTPFGVIQTIAEAPQDRIQDFADAFLLRRR